MWVGGKEGRDGGWREGGGRKGGGGREGGKEGGIARDTFPFGNQF